MPICTCLTRLQVPDLTAGTAEVSAECSSSSNAAVSHAAFMRAQAALPDWAITDGERKALASKQPLAHSRAAGPSPQHTKMKPATAKAPIDKAVTETACRAHTRNHTEAVACCRAPLALLGSDKSAHW